MCNDNAVLAAAMTAAGTGSHSTVPTAEIVLDGGVDVC